VPPPPGSIEVGAGDKTDDDVLEVDVGVDDVGVEVMFVDWVAEIEEFPPGDAVGEALESVTTTPTVTESCVRTPPENKTDWTTVYEVDRPGLLEEDEDPLLLPLELLLG